MSHVLEFEDKDINESYIIDSLVSGFDKIHSLDTNHLKNGLQIRNLKDVVLPHVYHGNAVVCYHLKSKPFQYSLEDERDLNQEHIAQYMSRNQYVPKFKQFWQEYKSAKYDFCNCSNSVNIKICPTMFSHPKKRLFCSEAVIRFIKKLDIVSQDINAEKISPEELGRWCGDVIGDSPFDPIPDIFYIDEL